MAAYARQSGNNQGNLGGQASSLVRPSYLQVDVSPYMGIPGQHLPSPTAYGAPPPTPFAMMQGYAFSAQNSPAGSGAGGLGARPPPVYTGANDSMINDQTLRSLQERVAQIASIKRLTAQELANMNAQHITPRNVGADGNRILMQEVTHLNPPGAARPPFMNSSSKLHMSSSSASLNDMMMQGRNTPAERNVRMHMVSTPSGSPPSMMIPMPPPAIKSSASPHSASRYICPTEEELRKLNELMPTGDDPESKKSVEEWKRFRLRVMSRLRKQRWRAKKKAEVLAGIEDTKREEAERKRRDRLRKQEQRARKKMKNTDSSSAPSSEAGDSANQAPDSPASSVDQDSEES